MGCNFGKLKSNDVVARKYSAASEEDEKNKEVKKKNLLRSKYGFDLFFF